VPFKDFAGLGMEKGLEGLLARHLFDVLFEQDPLMPVFQERPFQAEADILALTELGDLVIFELKLRAADRASLEQVFRYAQVVGQWDYSQLDQEYRKYRPKSSGLIEDHQSVFDLVRPLHEEEFNQRQHIKIVGTGADDELVKAVEYWRRQGVSIDFLPYRVYELGNDAYFEFFSPPHDRHGNPADRKGVLFDTNASWDSESIWYMMENDRVAAFGDAKKWVEVLNRGDTVFFYHRGWGVVAAATVTGDTKSDEEHTLFKDVRFVTDRPRRGDQTIRAMPARQVKHITDTGFYFARTAKVPYLSTAQSDRLVAELRNVVAR
ncbi:MAG: hypothetical protein OXC95_01760, partial [Dehalococcoidia bacterium]|nr:hypothetical protein [Dehalococcoidia bacterium]